MATPQPPETVSLIAVSLWPFLLLILALSRALYRRYSSPLRRYPGPLLASVSRAWKVISTAAGRTHLDHVALHRRYGPVVRIAPDEVSLSSPRAARYLLGAGRRFVKTDFYRVFPPPENPDIFTETREDVHAAKKRVANVPYSMGAMQQLSPFLDETIDVLARVLASKQQRTAADGDGDGDGDGSRDRDVDVDLGALLHFFAFDVLGEMAFSRSFGFLAAQHDVEHAIRTIDRSQMYNGIVGQVPELDALLRRNPLWQHVPWLSTGNALITRMALEEMARRRPFGEVVATTDGRRDLMASLIHAHLKDTDRFSEGDVFAVAHGAIFAGSDSTASTMQSFFWHVLTSTDTYEALLAEMDGAVAHGRVPAEGNVSWAQAQALPYFQACLRETMRLRPAVGLNMTRLVPPEGAELDGHVLPGGTRVAVNAWVLHRDRHVFGHDADDFRAERWLVDDETTRKMDRYMFQFGGGSHLCIGRNLALLEMNKVLPRLLRDYSFALVHPDREPKSHASFFVVQEGLLVHISKRGRANETDQAL